MADHKIATPHIEAAPQEIAKTVLMPGDPLRSRFIAENFFENPVLFNNIRGIQGYTGTYQGRRISVMASGMGMPSIGIYSYELFRLFDVDRIIRIGSAGAIRPDIKCYDIVFGMGACTTSRYAEQYHLPGTYAPIADFDLLRTAVDCAQKSGARYYVGNLLSADVFYDDTPSDVLAFSKMGVMAVEMEAAALYMNAARAGKEALALCTVSNNLITHEDTTAQERQTAFTQMIEIAFQTAVACEASGETESV